MHSRRRLLIIAVVFLYLAACGGGDSNSPNPTDTGLDIAGLDADAAGELDASDAGGDAASDTDLEERITVTGQVRFGDWHPIPGVQVGLLPGRVTTTDQNGMF